MRGSKKAARDVRRIRADSMLAPLCSWSGDASHYNPQCEVARGRNGLGSPWPLPLRTHWLVRLLPPLVTSLGNCGWWAWLLPCCPISMPQGIGLACPTDRFGVIEDSPTPSCLLSWRVGCSRLGLVAGLA